MKKIRTIIYILLFTCCLFFGGVENYQASETPIIDHFYSDMTVLELHNVDNYQIFDITTTHYDDNGYNLAIVFPDNSLIDKDFVSKYDCPQLSSIVLTRTSHTEATFSYVSDEPGTFYYILKA